MKHKESPFASDFYKINTVKAFNLTAIAYIFNSWSINNFIDCLYD